MRCVCFFVAIFFYCAHQLSADTSAAPLSQAEIKGLIEKEVKRLTKEMWGKKSSELLSVFLKKTLKKMQALLEASFKIAAQEAIKEIMREDGIKTYVDHTKTQSVFPFIGNPKGAQVILVFTDPYCNYCHESLALYERHAQKDTSFKLIIHDFPIGGKHSYNAVRALLAAHAEKKHPLLRKALHKQAQKQGQFLSKQELAALAKAQGVQTDKFEERMQDKKITNTIRKTLKLAKQFQISATPTFVILKSEHKKPRVEEGVVPPEELLGKPLKP